MAEKDPTVTSEVHTFSVQDPSIAPNVRSTNVVAVFTFSQPEADGTDNNHAQKATVDEDGDIVVVRRKSEPMEKKIFIEHSMKSSLELVGLQVWRGALFLADFILHHQREFAEKVILELASGVGLTSIVAAMFAKKVIATDVNRDAILDLMASNARLNSGLVRSEFITEELDFFADSLPQNVLQADIILAADVVYNDDLTLAFFKTLRKILVAPPSKTVYIALEKRYVFTTADLDIVTPCYDLFLNELDSLQRDLGLQASLADSSFPQYFNYERVKELVLWKACK